MRKHPVLNAGQTELDRFEHFMKRVEAINCASLSLSTRVIGQALDQFVGPHGLILPSTWKDDFALNLSIVERQLDDAERLGAWPAPAYARRLGILLRRLSLNDQSKRFDEVWSAILRRTMTDA